MNFMFHQRNVSFPRGSRISWITCWKNGIRVDPTKIEIKEKWPKLQNLTELRVLLGLGSF